MKWPVFWLILVNTELGSPENILKSAILEIWVLITTFLNDITLCAIDMKHCQRHNGPEGWVHITSLQFIVHSSQFPNLDQITISESQLSITSKSQPNISSSTKSKLRILTKIQLLNLNQTSAVKYWPNFSFQISPELQLQNLDQTLC